MIDKIKDFLFRELHIIDIICLLVGIIGVFHNMTDTVKFNPDDLLKVYAPIRGYIFASRVNESINNSNKGEMP